MSYYGDIADRFVQGYHVGERMKYNRDRRRESEAYGEMEDAEAAQSEAIPADGGYQYTGQFDQPAPTSGLDLNKGVSTESGGTMDAKTGVAASQGAIPAGGPAAPRPVDSRTGAAVPEGADSFSQQIQTDPKYFDAVRAARSKYLKAVSANDSGRALLLKKYFEENDQKTVVDSLYKASALAEAGDEAGAARYALQAYGMIDDGGAAQVRKVNGRLIGVGFDQKTGEYRNAFSLDAQSLFKLATQLKDPLAYRQLQREDAQDEREGESHDLQMETGRFNLGQAKELAPLQVASAKNQLTMQQKELANYDTKFGWERDKHEADMESTKAQSMYYLSKALGLDGSTASQYGFKKPGDWQAFDTKIGEATRETMAGMAGDESMEGTWAGQAGERDQSRVHAKATEYALTGMKVGNPASVASYVQAAVRISTFEDMLTGKLESDEAAVDRYAQEHGLNAVWDEKSQMMQLDVDGMPVFIPPRGNDAVLKYIHGKSQQVIADPKASAAEKAEAKELTVRLGEILGAGARAYAEAIPGGVPFSGDVEPPGMPGFNEAGALAGAAYQGVRGGVANIMEGIDTGYGN